MGIIDIHAHVLPGIDDGPEDLEATVALLQAAWQDGVRTIVATPHMFAAPFDNNDAWFVGRAYYNLLEQLDRVGRQPGYTFLQQLNVFLGAENMFGAAFVAALEEDKILTLKNTQNLLLEFGSAIPAAELVAGVELVLEKGKFPVLAHVERYRALESSPDLLAELRRMGCRTQVNAGSLQGMWPTRRRRRVLALIQRGLVDIVASDAHDAQLRPPRFTRAARMLRHYLPPAGVASLLHDEAARILAVDQQPSATP